MPECSRRLNCSPASAAAPCPTRCSIWPARLWPRTRTCRAGGPAGRRATASSRRRQVPGCWPSPRSASAYYAADNDRLTGLTGAPVTSAASRQRATEGLLRMSVSTGVWQHPEGVTMWGQPWRPLFCDWQVSLELGGLDGWELSGIDLDPAAGTPVATPDTISLAGRSPLVSGVAGTLAAAHRPVAHRRAAARPGRARAGRRGDRGGPGAAARTAGQRRPALGRPRRRPRAATRPGLRPRPGPLRRQRAARRHPPGAGRPVCPGCCRPGGSA